MKNSTLILLLFLFTEFFCFSQNRVDLSIENVNIKPSSPKIGDKVTISYEIKNIGTTVIPSEGYTATLIVNGKIVSFDDESPQLSPQQHATYSKINGAYHILVDSKKRYNWKIQVKLKKIKDENQKNNNYKNYFVVN